MMKAMKERGFTIAEALIVLAIIAILSYLLFPLFLKVKRQVQIYSSVSKLRQIHLAIENYRQAWDGADVFTSYRSYYRLGLPVVPDHRQDPKKPWEYFTDTTWRDWLSGCASTDLEENLVVLQEHYLASPITIVPPGFIGYVAPDYDPPMVENVSPNYLNYLPTYRQNIVLAVDPYCNPPGLSLASPLVSKRGISLLLSGQIVNKYAPGYMKDLKWWSDPPED